MLTEVSRQLKIYESGMVSKNWVTVNGSRCCLLTRMQYVYFNRSRNESDYLVQWSFFY